jgi:hypothetical protein
MQLRAPAPVPDQIGEADSMARILIDSRQDLIDIYHQIGEVDSLAKMIKDAVTAISSARNTAHRHI